MKSPEIPEKKEQSESWYRQLPSAPRFCTNEMQFCPDSRAYGQTCAYTRPVEPRLMYIHKKCYNRRGTGGVPPVQGINISQERLGLGFGFARYSGFGIISEGCITLSNKYQIMCDLSHKIILSSRISLEASSTDQGQSPLT